MQPAPKRYQVRSAEQLKPLEYDHRVKGIAGKRSCTDVFCCLIFGAFVAGWIVLAAFAIVWGNPEKLVNPTDSLGRICGVKTKFYDLSSKPYLYFFDMTKCFSYATVLEGCLTPQVCVERCPDYYFFWPPPESAAQNSMDVSSKLICTYDVNPKSMKTYTEIDRAITTGQCARYYVKSAPVTGRCIPSVIADLAPSEDDLRELNGITNNSTDQGRNSRSFNATALASPSGKNFVKVMLEAKSIGQKLLADVQIAWWQILIGLLGASVAAFLWVMIMRLVAWFMVYLSMVIILAASSAGSAYCWYQFVMVRKMEGDGAVQFHITARIEDYLKMSGTWLGFAIVCSIVFTIFFFSLVCLCGRIRLAIALIGESSKAVAAMLSSLFFPVVPFLLHLGVFTYAGTVAVYLASSGRPNCQILSATDGKSTNVSCDCDELSRRPAPLINGSGSSLSSCQFVNYTQDPYLIYMQLYNLFGFFWGIFFVSGLADVTLAGAFASYYWAFNKPRDIPAFPVIKAFWTAIRYHLGSIAFGSLVLAIVRIIRVILEYVEEKLKKSQNPIAMGCLKCMQCFFFCLEKFLKFLSKNAYIMIAIYGRNFCVSASEAFSLMLRNALRYMVLENLTDFLLFLGKLVITGGMGVASYFYFAGGYNYSEFLVGHLNYFFVPIIIVVIGTYLICSAFFGVYEMAVDTTFLCFLEDCERNDGSAEKPYFMARSLKKILDKHNEPVEQPPAMRY